jgi:hypothetical protein
MREVQVAPEHYDFERYDDPERWMSYWHQLRAVLSVRPKTVLEIGPGSGVFRNYLRAAGVEVKTLDIDATRGVDYVADITKLDQILPQGLMFDAICAFQVLEHLPLAELETCLANIARRGLRRRHHEARHGAARGPPVRRGVRVPGARAPAVRRIRARARHPRDGDRRVARRDGVHPAVSSPRRRSCHM